MAYELQIFDMGTQVAGEDLSAAQFLPVKIENASGAGVVVKIDSSGEAAVGVLQNNPAVNQAADVRVLGITKAVCVAGWTAGDKLQACPQGLATAGTGDYVVAIALETTSDGAIGTALLIQMGIAA